MKPIRRINLYGGPGSGKSTLSHELFGFLKRNLSLNLELVQEKAKTLAWTGQPINKWTQARLFAEQLSHEGSLLENGVDIVINDGPLDLNVYYAKKSDIPTAGLAQLSQWMDDIFTPYNIFINRGGKPYNPKGRYQDYSAALDVDLDIVKQYRFDLRFYYSDSANKLGTIVQNAINASRYTHQ